MPNRSQAEFGEIKARCAESRLVATRPSEILNPKTETDPAQPTLIKVTQEQFAKLIDKQVQLDLDFLDALAHLEAVRSVRDQNADKINDELKSRIEEEFKKSSKVAALIDQMHESEEFTKSKDQDAPLAVRAAREKLEKLRKDYEELWAIEFRGIRDRLTSEDRSPLSESRIRELEIAVERARRKKEGFAKQLESVQVIRNDVENHSFETGYVNNQLQSLMQWEDQVRKNLEQLRYEAANDPYRVTIIDGASAPNAAADPRAAKYMAAASYTVLFLVLGSFLALEIKAGRKASTMLE